MSFFGYFRGLKWLRKALLSISRQLLLPLRGGSGVLQRAAYDAMPVDYIVAGTHERFVVSTGDKVIGREVFLHGEFDLEKLRIALGLLERKGRKRPQCLIDVGANIGTIVIPALTRGVVRFAVAIEPHPQNLRLLRANLALNDVSSKVEVIAAAVGLKSGATLMLQESMTNSGNHAVGEIGLPVPSIRLDDLEMGGEETLLWMDIEGYEGHALKGAERMLASGVALVCEYNPLCLERSGGLPLFRDALSGLHIFDLKDDGCEISLDELEIRYPRDGRYTDILVLPQVNTEVLNRANN